LVDVIREFEPDVVYANWGSHGMSAAVAARRAGVPACVHFRGYDVTRDVQRNGWDPYRRTLVGATAVCNSEFIENLLRTNLQLPVRRIRYGGIDREIFQARERGRSWPVPLKLVCVGRLAPQKGADTAIEALARIRERRPEFDARLAVVGGGRDFLESLKTLAREEGVEQVVEFEGPKTRAEVAEALARSDVLLMPSRTVASGWSEAFGNVSVEGMVSGLPVIASDCGGLPSTVGDGGIIVPQGDSDRLAAAVIGLVESETPESCRTRALEWSQRYSREAMIADYDAVAREVAGLT
jgi:glycosyltransferase involved in cell wall biosynthesis